MSGEEQTAEQSMEDILQSIKKIIADEDDDDTLASEVQTDAADDGGVLELTDMVDDEADFAASEPLELNEIVGDEEGADSAILELNAEDVVAAPLPAVEEIPAPAPAAEPVAEEVPESIAEATPAPQPVAVEPAPEAETAQPSVPAIEEASSGIMSQAAAQASAGAFSALMAKAGVEQSAEAAAPTAFRSGVTIEDMVAEALQPLLKDWLDQNMQGIVERIVEKEVKRISGA